MKVTIVLLFLAQCFAVALCAPVEQSSKSVQWIDTDARDELENDIDNLIEPEDYAQTEVQKQMIKDAVSVQQKPEEPEHQKREPAFITGHRIPLELFSSATLRRIELIPEQTTVQDSNRYVNSESFRSSPSTSTSFEPRHYLPLQDDRETLLGPEIDPNYRRSLIKFLPDY